MPVKKAIADVAAVVAKLNRPSNSLFVISFASIILGAMLIIGASWLAGLGVVFNGLMVATIAIGIRDQGL